MSKQHVLRVNASLCSWAGQLGETRLQNFEQRGNVVGKEFLLSEGLDRVSQLGEDRHGRVQVVQRRAGGGAGRHGLDKVTGRLGEEFQVAEQVEEEVGVVGDEVVEEDGRVEGEGGEEGAEGGVGRDGARAAVRGGGVDVEEADQRLDLQQAIKQNSLKLIWWNERRYSSTVQQ